MSTERPLYWKVELRAITSSSRKWVSAVMMSSVRPSAKYSSSSARLMFSNGSTAMTGRAVGALRSVWAGADADAGAAVPIRAA